MKIAEFGNMWGFGRLVLLLEKEELKRFDAQARRYCSNLLEELFGVDYDLDPAILDAVAVGEKTPQDVIEELGIDDAPYFPSFEEAAAELILNRVLRQLRKVDERVPYMAKVLEETAYGVPEYSLYRGTDLRSWCGRWMFLGGPYLQEPVSFAREIAQCAPRPIDVKDVVEVVNRAFSLHERRGSPVIVAVWRL